MASSLLNLVNNLAKGIQKIKCKYVHDDKKCKTCKIKYKDCNCFLQYTNFKDDLVKQKCLGFNKNHRKKLKKELKKGFVNTYKFSNHDINKLILLLRKDVYLEKFSETLLPEKKKNSYSHLNMEDIKKLVKMLKIKIFAENHDLHAQSDTLLLTDAFENFRNMCLDPACFFTSLGLACKQP